MRATHARGGAEAASSISSQHQEPRWQQQPPPDENVLPPAIIMTPCDDATYIVRHFACHHAKTSVLKRKGNQDTIPRYHPPIRSPDTIPPDPLLLATASLILEWPYSSHPYFIPSRVIRQTWLTQNHYRPSDLTHT